jgi:hypothetical protein
MRSGVALGGWATATVTVHVREREGWFAQVKGEGAGEGGARERRYPRALAHTRAHACTPTAEPPGVSRGKPRLPGI